MIGLMLTNVKGVNRYWSQVVISMVWGQWQVLDAGLRATSKILEAASQAPADEADAPARTAESAAPVPSGAVEDLMEFAGKRMAQGLAPPREIYKAQYRKQIDWSKFPEWAKPSDPDVYEGCAHEG
jgi:hypothetical protein